MSHRSTSRLPARILKGLEERFRFAEPIELMRPAMPALDDYVEQIKGIWERRWLTNDGELVQELEARLGRELRVPHVSVSCNGTVALLLALSACGINEGEVITTPFTFPATPHALLWSRVRPVFADIDSQTFNLDPDCIESLVTPATRAILPVHVFGNPCDTIRIQEIANRHGLQVIYDAAHAIGVEVDDEPLVGRGDLSVLSLHATKLFSTAEGGGVVTRSPELHDRLGFLRNFGIADEETVVGLGINGKMSEFHAAYGLLALELLQDEVEQRARLAKRYRTRLEELDGISWQRFAPGVRQNYSYLSILIDAERFGMHRDEVYSALRLCNVQARKYFAPLCSHFDVYADLPSARPDRLPIAEQIADRVLCLPLYGSLAEDAVDRICALLGHLARA